MNPILKNIIAIIIGWFVGSFVNMGLIQIGQKVFPIEGVNLNDMAEYAALMPSLDSKFFIFPFLAHAIGTLVGATVAGLIATDNKMKFALGIGILFLVGGIFINYMLPGPIWFVILDILIAFIPMAWLGGKLALKWSKNN